MINSKNKKRDFVFGIFFKKYKLLKEILLVVISLLTTHSISLSQSNPEPYNLSEGNYSFTGWNASNSAGTYPPNMIFHKTDTQDPALEDETVSDYTSAYNLTSGTRINGKNNLGFSFLNTAVNGFLGAAVLAINTTGRQYVRVSWKGRTINPNSRIYRIALQYKVGNDESYVNLGSEYERNSVTGDSLELGPVVLPEDAFNQPVVYIRWKYYYYAGTGARAELAVDDIFIDSNPIQTETNFTLQLQSGWNLISSYVIPADSALDSITSSISNNLVILKNNSGNFYVPAFGIDLIHFWNFTQGYYLYMLNQDSITFSGERAIPENCPIQLLAGWNTIAYLRDSSMNVIDALDSISNDLLIIKDGNGHFYVPGFNINTIGNMQPGFGYQIYMLASRTFTYPTN